MVASYSVLYEEGEVEHINVLPSFLTSTASFVGIGLFMGCYPHVIRQSSPLVLICVCDSVVSFGGLAASVLAACALVCINRLPVSRHFGLVCSEPITPSVLLLKGG